MWHNCCQLMQGYKVNKFAAREAHAERAPLESIMLSDGAQHPLIQQRWAPLSSSEHRCTRRVAACACRCSLHARRKKGAVVKYLPRRYIYFVTLFSTREQFGPGELFSLRVYNSFVAHGSKIWIKAVNQRSFAPPGASFLAHAFRCYFNDGCIMMQIIPMIYNSIMHLQRPTHPLVFFSAREIFYCCHFGSRWLVAFYGSGDTEIYLRELIIPYP